MDIVRLATAGIAANTTVAPLICFAAGIVTSLGPCIAPRMIAVSGVAGSAGTPNQRRWSIALIVAGLCVGYVGLGVAATVLAGLLRQETALYLLFALAFLVCGSWNMLVAGRETPCCRPAPRASSSFLLGLMFTLVVSPCCTPIIASISTLTESGTQWWYAAENMLAFALGHAVPLVAVGLFGSSLRERLEQHSEAVGIVSASLLIGLAGYYAVLL